MITAIQQIAIVVHDVGRARDFYRDKLGLRHLFDAGPELAFFDCGGVRLMLSKPSSPDLDHASSLMYFRVADIRAAHRDMVGKGVTFRDEPHLVGRKPDGGEVWLASFDDTEGNTLALMSEPPVKA
jgi:predicted enzyme related to lactoylglutathione lyase